TLEIYTPSLHDALPILQLWNLPNISIAPEVIFGGWITNTLFCTWISIIVLLLIFYFGIRRRDLIPSGWQNFIEWMVESLLGLVRSEEHTSELQSLRHLV